MPGYTLPDGKTLKNKLGATSPEELERLESPIIEARSTELQLGGGPQGRFDLEHLKAIHAHLFQDVVEWAGHTRDERFRFADGSIGTEPIMRKPGGKDFAIGPEIRPALDSTFARLADQNYLRGLDRDTFAERAAQVLSAVNNIHGFREGNGRSQRAFMTALAQKAGHEMRFDVVSRERMSQISIAAHERGDVSGFQRMIREITDPERVSALGQAQAFLDKHGGDKFDWRDRYMATTEEGRSYSLVMVGQAGPNFMARTSSEILIGRSSDLPDPVPTNGETFRITTAVQQAPDRQDSAPQRIYNKDGVDITGGDEPEQKQSSSAQKM